MDSRSRQTPMTRISLRWNVRTLCPWVVEVLLLEADLLKAHNDVLVRIGSSPQKYFDSLWRLCAFCIHDF